MAAGRHKLSRRALLAGACVAPMLDPSVLLGSAPRRDPAWEKAVARLARAEEAIGALADSAEGRAYDRAVGRRTAALSRVLNALAPDLAALGAKIGLIARHQAWELSFGEQPSRRWRKMCGGWRRSKRNSAPPCRPQWRRPAGPAGSALAGPALSGRARIKRICPTR